ncbi:MAG TPA: cytochrome c [Planctomycetota bacterium]
MRPGKALLFAALVTVLALLLAQRLLRGNPDRRNYEIFAEMVHPVAGESFGVSAVLPGGRVMQPLQAGVVLYGEQPFLYGPGEDEALRAGVELVSPFAADDAAALREGARLYGIYCLLCHDSKGEGHGPVVQRGMLPPASLLADRARAMAAGQMFHVLTRGQGNMASYAAQLTPEQRWQVILHVRSLQEAPL